LKEHRIGAVIEVPADRVNALPATLYPVVVGRLVAQPGIRVDGAELLPQSHIDGWSTSFEKELA
jgi:hypothetical protein